jgi:hypothetical protein
MTQAVLPLTTDAKSLPANGLRPRVWPNVLAAVLGLIYLVWAGSNADPRKVELWMYTKTGWFVPAAGLGHLWAASILVISALSLLSIRAEKAVISNKTDEKPRDMWGILAKIAVIGIILIVALDVRLAVWRIWEPLVLDKAVIGPRTFKAVALGSRGWAIVADMITLGLLLLALGAQRRSLWLAGLYAFHPVVIMQVAGNGSPIVWWAPLAVLVGLGWRFQKWLRELIIMGAAAGCAWWVAHLALTQVPFNGLLAECLEALGWEERPVAVALIVIEILLQAAVVYLALRRGWNLARTLGHVLVAWALVSPRVMPADVLPILVLLPLGWTRAGWVLGGTILALYAIVPWNVGHQALRVPSWVMFLIMMPVAVTALEEWVMGFFKEE